MMSHLGKVEVRVGGDGCQELHPGLGEVVRLVDARHPEDWAYIGGLFSISILVGFSILQ